MESRGRRGKTKEDGGGKYEKGEKGKQNEKENIEGKYKGEREKRGMSW